MTDRVHALTVLLDRDFRDDDVQAIVQAIRMIKHVAAVQMHITAPDDWFARTRTSEVQRRLWDTIEEILKDKN